MWVQHDWQKLRKLRWQKGPITYTTQKSLCHENCGTLEFHHNIYKLWNCVETSSNTWYEEPAIQTECINTESVLCMPVMAFDKCWPSMRLLNSWVVGDMWHSSRVWNHSGARTCCNFRSWGIERNISRQQLWCLEGILFSVGTRDR